MVGKDALMENGYVPCQHENRSPIVCNDIFFGLVHYGYICDDCGESFLNEEGPTVVGEKP